MLGVSLKKIFGAVAGFLLSVTAGPGTVRAQQKPAMEDPAVDMQWGVKIPARDGVKLNATVFTPHGQKEPLPVIFTFTPYIGDSYTDRAVYFAKHGYVYALVDVRGRGNSGGEFEPFVNEGRDGYDVVVRANLVHPYFIKLHQPLIIPTPAAFNTTNEEWTSYAFRVLRLRSPEPIQVAMFR